MEICTVESSKTIKNQERAIINSQMGIVTRAVSKKEKEQAMGL